MGRMLETLKFGDGFRSKDKPFFEDALEREAAPPAPVEPEEDIPFIEVGPNKSLEGSPHVLALKHPPQPKQPPHPPTIKAAVPELATFKPMAVAFEPWPGAHLPGGIAPEVITHHQPEHPISKQYRELLAQMLEGCPASPGLLFVGGRRQVGASTVVMNLAVSATAARGLKVAVVEVNLKQPGLATRLGLQAATGLQDVLAGKLALEPAVLPTKIPHLHLLPAQVGLPGHLTAEAMRWLTGWLRARFDLVLLDGPPVDGGGDLAALAGVVEGMYLVLPQGENQQSQRALAQSLTALGGRLRGVVHTHFEL